jgi:hypothetical protein
VDERVTAGQLGAVDATSDYIPGFHMETKVTAVGRYVLHVFRTCDSAAGGCNEGARQDGARSFQFTVQAQTIKRGSLLWDTAPRCDAAGANCNTYTYKQADGIAVVARGYGGMMAAVGGRYVVGVGGRAWSLCRSKP